VLGDDLKYFEDEDAWGNGASLGTLAFVADTSTHVAAMKVAFESVEKTKGNRSAMSGQERSQRESSSWTAFSPLPRR
jgi:hypothetical protein